MRVLLIEDDRMIGDSLIAALKRLNYRGWIAVEPFEYMPDGAVCAARSIGYLQGLMEATP